MKGTKTNRARTKDRQTIETPYQEKSLLRSELEVLYVNNVVQLSAPTLVWFVVILGEGRLPLRSLVNRLPSGTGRDCDRAWDRHPCPKSLLSLCCGCRDGVGSVHLEPFPLFSAFSCDFLGGRCTTRQMKLFISCQKNQYLSPTAQPHGRSLALKTRTARSLKGCLFQRNLSATALSSPSGWLPTQIS